MGITDIIWKYFKPSVNEGYNPTTLPIDVENDLRSEVLLGAPSHVTRNDRPRGSDHDSNIVIHRYNESDGDQIFSEMENLFKNFFNFGVTNRPFFEEPSGDQENFQFFDPDHQPQSSSSDDKNISPRDEMLNHEKHPRQDSFERMFPFDDRRGMFGEDQDKRISSMFHELFNFPLAREGFHFPFERHRPTLDDKSDKDLDGDVSNGTQSLDDILDYSKPPSQQRNSFNFSTTTRRITSDGCVESRTTKTDSSGNEKVIVSRSMGDQTHTVTSEKLANGEEVKKEDLVNIKPDELENFEAKWKTTPRGCENSSSTWIFPWSKPKL